MGGEAVSEPHFMMRTMVTRYSGGVPTEVACVCGGCDPQSFIYGHGATLTECSADLQAKFTEHAAVSP
jgi:hypothetical protein